jgi:membrane protease YdiL (CAAX protease family)
MKTIKSEILEQWKQLKSLDKKVVIVFISVAIFQTIAWYYASRGFFNANLHDQYFADNKFVKLYEYLFWFIGNFISFFLLPVFVIIFIFKEKISDYGVKFGDYKLGFIVTFISIAFMLPILWFVSAFPEFSAKYPHLQIAKSDWTVFIIYEIGILIYLFAWEFIWRGYMLFGLEEKFGYYAVFIQMIPFVILHNGKPDIETFSSIIGAIILGVLALRTRSFLYGVFIHYAIMLGIDLFSTMRSRADSLRELFSNVF